MTYRFSDAMLEATRLTRAGHLMEATAALQQLLGGSPLGGSPGGPWTREADTEAAEPGGPPTIDGVAEPLETPAPARLSGPTPRDRTGKSAFSGGGDAPTQPLPFGTAPFAASVRTAPSAASVREVFASLAGGVFGTHGAKGGKGHQGHEIPAGGQFLATTFTGPAGSRPYKLYVPSSYSAGTPVPLIVMLHGCTQSPDDFAAGTRMNEVAEAHGCLVAYPAQTSRANAQKCWNWFNEKDQRREGGEAALIAGITREVMREYAVDPRRVFVAGLSAGGAAAAIMGAAYPDLYAAIGVHSGLACGAARDMPSAFAAMRQGAEGTGARSAVPTIVFHGDRDATVNPRNGDAVAAGALPASGARAETEEGRVADGHAYRRMRHLDAQGRTVAEQWVIRGAGHAWSGGSPAGS